MTTQSSPTMSDLLQLQSDMGERLQFQLSDLRLEKRNNEIVIAGHAISYYSKQLAQEYVIRRNYPETLVNRITVDRTYPVGM